MIFLFPNFSKRCMSANVFQSLIPNDLWPRAIYYSSFTYLCVKMIDIFFHIQWLQKILAHALILRWSIPFFIRLYFSLSWYQIVGYHTKIPTNNTKFNILANNYLVCKYYKNMVWLYFLQPLYLFIERK